MYNQLIDKVQYLNEDMPFLISTFIREYDMTKSNISILLYKGYINQEQYNYYASLPKMERQVAIGMLQKDEKVANLIKDGMKEMRNRFITENNLDPSRVLSIKNDAFFLIDTIPVKTKFDNVEFIVKNTYTSYYHIKGLELYYSYNQMSREEKLDVKGISDNKVKLHENDFVDLLKALFYSAQMDPITETISMISNVYQNYVTKQFNANFYREFNQISKIKLKVGNSYFYSDFLSEEDKPYIDISYNLNILRDLSAYYSLILQRR